MTENLALSTFTLPLSNASNYQQGTLDSLCCLATAYFRPGNKRNFGTPLISKLTCNYLLFLFSENLFQKVSRKIELNVCFGRDAFLVTLLWKKREFSSTLRIVELTSKHWTEGIISRSLKSRSLYSRLVSLFFSLQCRWFWVSAVCTFFA